MTDETTDASTGGGTGGTGGNAFSGTTARALFVVGSTAFIAILLTQIFGDRLGLGRSFGPGPTSVSAIGTQGFAKTLERLGFTVETGERAAPSRHDGVPVFTEPHVQLATPTRRALALKGFERAVVVLPKWSGQASTPDNRWIGSVSPTSAGSTLWRRLGEDGTVKRHDEMGPLTHAYAGTEPALEDPQLVSESNLEPIFASEKGVLAGTFDFMEDDIDIRILVIADPDLIANHNLDEGDNAVIAVRLMERFAPPGAALVFAVAPGGAGLAFWQKLFTPPYAVITLQVLLALGVVVWAGAGRFGSPVKSAPELRAGREQLIANAADLLDQARHGPVVLQGYARALVHEVATAMRAPRGADEAETLRWLDERARARGLKGEAQALFERAHGAGTDGPLSSRRIARIATALHRWKREMTHDARRHP